MLDGHKCMHLLPHSLGGGILKKSRSSCSVARTRYALPRCRLSMELFSANDVKTKQLEGIQAQKHIRDENVTLQHTRRLLDVFPLLHA